MEILLNISAETSMTRKGKNLEDDKYEKDKCLLQAVKDKYVDIFLNKNPQDKMFILNGESSAYLVTQDIWKIVSSLYDL